VLLSYHDLGVRWSDIKYRYYSDTGQNHWIGYWRIASEYNTWVSCRKERWSACVTQGCQVFTTKPTQLLPKTSPITF